MVESLLYTWRWKSVPMINFWIIFSLKVKDNTFFFLGFNWSYLQTVWSAVNLKYNPYLLYIAFWFANCLQEYENYCCKIKTLEKQGKDHSYQETNWKEQVLQPTMGPLCFMHLFHATAHVCHVVTGGFLPIRLCVSSGSIFKRSSDRLCHAAQQM